MTQSRSELIEKIRKAVIIANNPECKSYEEALNKEFKNSNCLVKYRNSESSYEISSLKEFTTMTIFYRLLNEKLNTQQIQQILKNQEFITEINSIIHSSLNSNNQDLIGLGLQLTLERILVALNTNSEVSYFTFGTGDIFCFEDKELSIGWQPSKTLEEQSDETIEEIAEILNYDAK